MGQGKGVELRLEIVEAGNGGVEVGKLEEGGLLEPPGEGYRVQRQEGLAAEGVVLDRLSCSQRRR